MNTNEVTKLNPQDRVRDTRDGAMATVLNVNEHILRVRYDDSQSSNYIYPADCQHLEKVEFPQYGN